MNIAICLLLLIVFMSPSTSFGGENSEGTVILISSVSGWLLLGATVLYWKEIKRFGRKQG